MANKKTTYEPAPEVPAELAARWTAMLSVLSGQTTVSEAARSLGLSRQRFLTLMHRGMAALMEAIAPHPAGRPARSKRELELEQENEQLSRENARLQRRVEMIDRILTVTGQLARERAAPRARRPKKTTPTNDEEEGPRERLRGACSMRELGVSAMLAAALVGCAPSTVRRWARRDRAREPLRRRRGPRNAPALSMDRAQAVQAHVRALNGLVGAESIAHSIEGVSRRQAAAIKRQTLTQMERERVAAAERIIITAPGIVRGFDAMHVQGENVLVAADACVPYRTSAVVAARYDEQSVARALARDFEQHGAPLVLRADRARVHDAPAVRRVLNEHGVLMLHGPPRLPRFYGQLERQNREHRAWLLAGAACDGPLQETCERMLDALNGLWRRRTLDWRTAQEVWDERATLLDDRESLRREVIDAVGESTDLNDLRSAWLVRRGIELALTNRGYLKREAGGWC